MEKTLLKVIGQMGADRFTFSPGSGRLLLLICLGQIGLIALPFFKNEMAAPVLVLVLLSVTALFGSITFAVIYLCAVSVVVPSWFFDDFLMLPGDVKFYEGLFAVVAGMAALIWMLEGKLHWRHHTRLDRPVLVFLGLLVFSVFLGKYYGQPTSQMLRDIRFPSYYALFFVVTWFFDVGKSRLFLIVILSVSAVVGIEYLIEFLQMVNLSVSGAFFRVARIEGLMLPFGALTITALLLYDAALHRRLASCLALVPIALALMITVGRGIWITVAVGMLCLAGVSMLDRQARSMRRRHVTILMLVFALMVGAVYVFQRMTQVGTAEMAVSRIQSAANYEEDVTILGRLMTYQIALTRIMQHPVLGGGHGVYISIPRVDLKGRAYIAVVGGVDNVYLTLMLRMGIVGMAAFLWVYIRGLRIAYDLLRKTRQPHVRQLCATFFAVYGAMLVYGIADSSLMTNRLIFVHATFLGILGRLDQQEERAA